MTMLHAFQRRCLAVLLSATGLAASVTAATAAEDCHYFDILESTICSITKGDGKAGEKADLSWSTATYDERTYKYGWQVFEPTMNCRIGDIFVARMRAETFRPQVLLKNYGGEIIALSVLQERVDPASGGPVYVAEVQWRCLGGGPPVVDFTMAEIDTPGPFAFDWEVWNRTEVVEPIVQPAQADDCDCFDVGTQSYYPSTQGVCGPPPSTAEKQAASWRC